MAKDPQEHRLDVESLINQAVQQRASDVHFEPTSQGYDLRYRIDGLLQTVTRLPADQGRVMVTRLMVRGQLLTYRLDVPQEGRVHMPSTVADQPLELRLAIMPTIHGLRAVVRLPADLTQPKHLDELDLPEPVLNGLKQFAEADSGMLLLVGPAGSGKTTTIYALLDDILRTQPGLSIIALEDPVERDLPGVTQIEVSPFGSLTYERTLKSLLRQDPQVLMLGEIRDPATASIALQATLSGHRLISTLHASSPAGAVARLIEMGLEPYQITSALFGVVAQRLLRRRQDDGYAGRFPVAVFAAMDDPLRQAVIRHADASELEDALQQQHGYRTISQAAMDAVAHGLTDTEEVRRVLGIDISRT